MTSELTDGSVFLHVPKTGGSWVAKVLADMRFIRMPVGRQPHAPYIHAAFFPKLKARWKDLSFAKNWSFAQLGRPGVTTQVPFSFCFVRHPIRWYESWWRFIKGMGGAKGTPWFENSRNPANLIKRWTVTHLLFQHYDEDFNKFVQAVHEAFPGYVTWLYGQFAPPNISFVGKQENLTEDLIAVLRDRGFKFDEERVRNFPRVNESAISCGAIRWDPILLREVQSAEMPTLLRFGYSPIERSDKSVGGIARAG